METEYLRGFVPQNHIFGVKTKGYVSLKYIYVVWAFHPKN